MPFGIGGSKADAVIAVALVGDSKNLQSELKKGESSLGGFNKKALALGAGLAAGLAAGAVADFMGDALGEADRLGDAMARLGNTIGTDLAASLETGADDFSALGLSMQDVLELEADFAEFLTGQGIDSTAIAELADEAAATAGALALIRDEDPEAIMGLIEKAGLGAEKAMRELGISVTDAEVEVQALKDTGKTNADTLTEQELAAARYKLVLEELKPVLDDATTGTADFEQKSKELEAKWETLQAKIGQAVEGPLADLLNWILQGIEGWEMLIEILPSVGAAIENLLDPLADVADSIADVIYRLGRLNEFDIGGAIAGSGNNRNRGGGGNNVFGGGTSQRTNVTIVTGADPEETAAAIGTWHNQFGGGP